MTMDDTRKFLMMVNAFFPAWKVDNPAETAAAWNWALAEYSVDEVNMALQIYIRTNTSGFAPSVSQIIAAINAPKEIKTMNEMEAWALVKRAIADSAYNSQERFDELPPLVQKAVGNPRMLHEWGMTDSESVNTVIMSNFQRTYRSVVEREKFNERIMPQVSQFLEKREVAQIGGKTE